MSFNVSPKETIAKCDYSNPYRAFPESGSIAAANRAKALRDVQETEEMRMERELMERFMNQNFRMQGDSYIFLVAKVGKFLFLAITLPPYLAFYGIPKWVLTQAIAIISSVTNDALSMIAKGVAHLNPWNADVFAVQFRRFLDAFSWRTKIADRTELVYNDLKSLPTRLLEKLYKLTETVKQAFVGVKEKIQEKVAVVKEFISAKYEKVSQFVQKQVEKLNDWVSSQVDKVMAPVYSTYEKIKEPIVTALSFLKQKVDELNEKIKEKTHSIAKTVESVSQTITSAAVQALHTLYTQIEPYMNWTYPIAPWIYNQSSIAVRYSLQRIAEIVETTQLYLQKIYETGQKIAVWSSNQMQSLASYTYNKTVKVFTPFAKFTKKLGQALKKIAEKRAKKLHDFAGKQFLRLKRATQYMGQQGKKAAQFIWNQVKSAPQKMILLVQKAAQSFVSFIAWFFRSIKLLFIWTKVLFMYGMYLLKDLNQEITGWVTPYAKR